MNERDHEILNKIENNINGYKFIHDDNLYNEFMKTKSEYIKITLLGANDNKSELNTQENNLTEEYNKYLSPSDQQLLNEYGKGEFDKYFNPIENQSFNNKFNINRTTGGDITIYTKQPEQPKEQNIILNPSIDNKINERVRNRFDSNKKTCRTYGKVTTNSIEILIKADNRWLFYTNNNYVVDKYNNNIFELYVSNPTDKYSNTLDDNQKKSLSSLYSSIFSLCFCIEWSLMVLLPYFKYRQTVDDFINNMKNDIINIYYPQYQQLKTDMLEIFDNLKESLQIDSNNYNDYSFLLDFGNSLAVSFGREGNCYLSPFVPFFRNLCNITNLEDLKDLDEYEEYMLKCNPNRLKIENNHDEVCRYAIKWKSMTMIPNFIDRNINTLNLNNIFKGALQCKYKLLQKLYKSNQDTIKLHGMLWSPFHAGYAITSKEAYEYKPLEEETMKDINSNEEYSKAYSLLCDGNYLMFAPFAILSHDFKLSSNETQPKENYYGYDLKLLSIELHPKENYYGDDGVIKPVLKNKDQYYEYYITEINFYQILKDIYKTDKDKNYIDTVYQRWDHGIYDLSIIIKKQYINQHTSPYNENLKYIYPIKCIIESHKTGKKESYADFIYLHYKHNKIQQNFFKKREFIALVRDIIWTIWCIETSRASFPGKSFEELITLSKYNSSMYLSTNIYTCLDFDKQGEMMIFTKDQAPLTRLMDNVSRNGRKPIPNYTKFMAYYNKDNNSINKRDTNLNAIFQKDNADRQKINDHYQELKNIRLKTIQQIRKMAWVNNFKNNITDIDDDWMKIYFNDSYDYFYKLNKNLKSIKSMINNINNYVYGLNSTPISTNGTNNVNKAYNENRDDEYRENITKFNGYINLSNSLFKMFENHITLSKGILLDRYNLYISKNEDKYKFNVKIGDNYLKEEEKYLTMKYNDYDDLINYNDKMNKYISTWDETFLDGGFTFNYMLIFIIVIILIVIVVIIIIRKRKIMNNKY